MKKFVNIDRLFFNNLLTTWIDKLTFIRILLLWIFIIFSFGVIYHFFSTPSAYLFDNVSKIPVNNMADSIYFSFITATTTGFGDIVPVGSFKLVATLQVIFGLLLLALVTSRLVSIKQDVILGEIYEISFNEKINRFRSSLLLFRQALNRVIVKIDDDTIRKKEVRDVYVEIATIENILEEFIPFFSRQRHTFMKRIDPVSAELLLHSINLSFNKLLELAENLEEGKHDWKRPVTVDVIKKSLDLYDECFSKVKNRIVEKKFEDLASEKDEIINSVKKLL